MRAFLLYRAHASVSVQPPKQRRNSGSAAIRLRMVRGPSQPRRIGTRTPHARRMSGLLRSDARPLPNEALVALQPSRRPSLPLETPRMPHQCRAMPRRSVAYSGWLGQNALASPSHCPRRMPL